MAEIAPGLFVSDCITPGFIYEMDLRAMFQFGEPPSGLGGSGRGVAISTSTWERIPGAKREELLDDLTRQSAEWGIERLAQHLRAALTEGEANDG